MGELRGLVVGIFYILVLIAFMFRKRFLRSEKIKKLNVSGKSILIMELGWLPLFLFIFIQIFKELAKYGGEGIGFAILVCFIWSVFGLVFIKVFSSAIEVILRILLQKKMISERTTNTTPFIVSGFIFFSSLIFVRLMGWW